MWRKRKTDFKVSVLTDHNVPFFCVLLYTRSSYYGQPFSKQSNTLIIRVLYVIFIKFIARQTCQN